MINDDAFLNTVLGYNNEVQKVKLNSFSGISCEMSMEHKIQRYILRDYSKDIRPEPSHATPLEVHFDMKLQKIVKLVR